MNRQQLYYTTLLHRTSLRGVPTTHKVMFIPGDTVLWTVGIRSHALDSEAPPTSVSLTSTCPEWLSLPCFYRLRLPGYPAPSVLTSTAWQVETRVEARSLVILIFVIQNSRFIYLNHFLCICHIPGTRSITMNKIDNLSLHEA